jgi:hypothetical protein
MTTAAAGRRSSLEWTRATSGRLAGREACATEDTPTFMKVRGRKPIPTVQEAYRAELREACVLEDAA